MQLLRLEVKNWVHHRYRICEFTRGLVAILGENGSGKSSLFGAIRWLLTGENPNFGVKADNISQYAKDGEPSYASLEFEHNGHIAVVTRHLLPEKEQATLTVDGKEAGRGDKAVTAGIEKLLGVDAKFISRFIIVSQTEIFSFIDDNQTDTDKFFQRLFNTAKADKCQDVIGKGLSKLVVPEILDSAVVLETKKQALEQDANALLASINKLPTLDDFLTAQKTDQDVIKTWEAHEKAASELAQLFEQERSYQTQLDTAVATCAQYDEDLSALTDAANGHEAAHSAARVALGHWSAYKQVAAAKAGLQADRAAIHAEREANLEVSAVAAGVIEELHGRLSTLHKQLKEAKAFVAMFGSTGVAQCPTCQTPTTDLQGHLQKTEQHDIPELNKQISEAETALSDHQAVDAAYKKWEKLNSALNARERQINDAEAKLAEVAAPTSTEDELQRAVVDYEEFQRVKQEIQPLAQKAREDKAGLDGALDNLRKRKQQLEDELTSCHVTAADAHLAQTRLTKRQELLKVRNDQVEQRNRLLFDIQRLEDQCAIVKEQEQSAVKLRKWHVVAEQAREALKHAPRLVAQRNLQRLEAAINELLQIFRVNFLVKVATDGTPTFIAEFFDGRRQVAQRLSVGQKTVLALAFRVAVNAMFAEEIGLLALDEPTASLDQPRIQALAPVLEKLRELSTAKGLQCLLVTHATNLSHLFESAIELEAPELRHVQHT
jgi:DNA repair protein SbcC/Rad50